MCISQSVLVLLDSTSMVADKCAPLIDIRDLNKLYYETTRTVNQKVPNT